MHTSMCCSVGFRGLNNDQYQFEVCLTWRVPELHKESLQMIWATMQAPTPLQAPDQASTELAVQPPHKPDQPLALKAPLQPPPWYWVRNGKMDKKMEATIVY